MGNSKSFGVSASALRTCSLKQEYEQINDRSFSRLGFFPGTTSLRYVFKHNDVFPFSFGLRHDTGDCAKGYIMQGSQASGSNAHHWSLCSKDKLREVFT